jgi:AcrR family transcriptional regulator
MSPNRSSEALRADRRRGRADAQPKAAKAAPAGSAPPRPGASRPYRRAQRDRGAETRAQLVEAALDVFGRLGFEGASTREIARAAGANLAAIAYHFGSKEALLIAVAEHVAGRIGGAVGPALALAAEPAAAATPEAARTMLTRLLMTYVDVMLGSAEAERWARFIVREQMQPSAAFEVIFRVMGSAAVIGTRLVSVALGIPEDEEARLRTFTLIGQVLVFRVAEAMVLRRMGWKAIGAGERAKIKEVVTANLDAILGGKPSP